MSFLGLPKKSLEHHAYLIESVWEPIRDELLHFIESDLGIRTRGNPDFWLGRFETFGIDDGRILKDLQSRKAFDAEKGKKIFVIAFDFITSEAQNSLLKVFEEPTAGTHFFVVTGSADALFPTLRSRLVEVVVRVPQKEHVRGQAKKFLESSLSERFSLVYPLIDERDKSKTISFLDHLELEMKNNEATAEMEEDYIFAFDEISKAKSFLHDRAPSLKLILEHIALVVPAPKKRQPTL